MENKRHWSKRMDDRIWLIFSSKKSNSRGGTFGFLVAPWVAVGMLIVVCDMVVVGAAMEGWPIWVWVLFGGVPLVMAIIIGRGLWHSAVKEGAVDAIYQCYLKRWQATKERLDKQKAR